MQVAAVAATALGVNGNSLLRIPTFGRELWRVFCKIRHGGKLRTASGEVKDIARYSSGGI